jgi:dTDP-4-amino-4,6-dideoxygalactose transaminase
MKNDPAIREAGVPFVDLHAQYLSIRNEIDCAMQEVIRESDFIRGRFVQTFEKEFAGKSGADLIRL